MIFSFSLTLFSSGCNGDDDCSDDLIGTPSSSKAVQDPSLKQFLAEIEEVENSDGYFIIFKEGGPFNEYRSSGLQIHGTFGEKGPSLLVDGVELLDEFNGRLNTTSSQARVRMSEYFLGTKSAKFKLFDAETNKLVLAESSVAFPNQLVVRADKGLQDGEFSRDTKIEWDSDGTKGEIFVVVYTGPGSTIPGLIRDGSYKPVYKVFSVPNDGSYQFTKSDFKDFGSNQPVTIMILRYEKQVIKDGTSSNMVLALTITGGNYVLP